jgi:hypothetical protein
VPQYYFFVNAASLATDVLARMDAFGFGITHRLPEQFRERVMNYQAGIRIDLGPKKASDYRRKQQSIGWQSQKQIKDKGPDTDDEPKGPQEEDQWQKYNPTWWQEAKQDDSTTASYGNWRHRTSWRDQRQRSDSEGHRDAERAAHSSTPSSSSTSRASPYQETPWSERSASWKRNDDRWKK